MVKCNNSQVQAPNIEEIVFRTIKEKISQPAIIKKYIDILKNQHESTKDKYTNKITLCQSKIDKLEVKQNRVLDLYADEDIDKDIYIKKINEIKNDMNILQDDKAGYQGKISFLQQKKDLIKNIDSFCKKININFNNLGNDELRSLVQTAISEITIFKNGKKGGKVIIKGFIPILSQNTPLSSKCCTRGGCG